MSDDFSECIFTSDDSPIDVTISHHRDRLVFGGKVEQDYRFVTYRFADANGDVSACMYLDDTLCVKITDPIYSKPIPDPVMEYLRRRFDTIEQVGGANGYVLIWTSQEPKKRQ
jgi:hypothetical protein